jgi:hypothetical protein
LALVLLAPGGLPNAPPTAQAQRETGQWLDPMAPFPQDDIFRARLMRRFNAERQRSMVSHADALLKLAGELKAEIDSASRNSLSPGQLRKVIEIERLARKVKQEMRIVPGAS